MYCKYPVASWGERLQIWWYVTVDLDQFVYNWCLINNSVGIWKSDWWNSTNTRWFEERGKKIENDRKKLEVEKQISKWIENMDVLQLNVETLTKIAKSTLSLMFNGRWEHKLQRDQNGNDFFWISISSFFVSNDEFQ